MKEKDSERITMQPFGENDETKEDRPCIFLFSLIIFVRLLFCLLFFLVQNSCIYVYESLILRLQIFSSSFFSHSGIYGLCCLIRLNEMTVTESAKEINARTLEDELFQIEMENMLYFIRILVYCFNRLKIKFIYQIEMIDLIKTYWGKEG